MVNHHASTTVNVEEILTFLEYGGQMLNTPQTVIATAILYFHTCYKEFHPKLWTISSDTISWINQSPSHLQFTIPKNHPSKLGLFHPLLMASACLFISCKKNEHLRRMRDMINVVYQFFHWKQHPSSTEPTEVLSIASDEYQKMKTLITEYEQIILRQLQFEFRCDLPYQYAIPYWHSLMQELATTDEKVNTSLFSTLLQQTLRIINQSLHVPQLYSTKEFSISDIAVTSIFLAIETYKKQFPRDAQVLHTILQCKEREWYQVFGTSLQTMSQISEILCKTAFYFLESRSLEPSNK